MLQRSQATKHRVSRHQVFICTHYTDRLEWHNTNNQVDSRDCDRQVLLSLIVNRNWTVVYWQERNQAHGRSA